MTDYAALITSLGTLATVIVGVATLWVKVSRTVGQNGGSTLHDIVARIERRQQQLGERVASLEATLKHHMRED